MLLVTILMIAVAGCGRVGFDTDAEVADADVDTSPSTDAMMDAPVDAPVDTSGRDAAEDTRVSGCTECGPCTTCVDGSCVPIPDGATCDGGRCRAGACCTGCWSGTACHPGETVDACGGGGDWCSACSCPGTTCEGVMGCLPTSRAVDVAAGGTHTCALRSDGSLFCWGDNSEGQLGLGDNVSRNAPTVRTVGGVDLFSGDHEHVCARVGGVLQCWGRGWEGQLSNGSPASVNAPTSAILPMGVTIATLDTGFIGTCFAGATSGIYCAGRNAQGSLGLGATSADYDPFTRLPIDGIFSTVVNGHENGCAIQTIEGRLFCWGNNMVPTVGVGPTPTLVPSPTPVATSFEDVDVGYVHACGVDLLGALHCWGGNIFGQLGLGHTENRDVPTQVGEDRRWRRVSLAARANHTCVTHDFGAYCFGANASGQLGTGDREDRLFPEEVRVAATVRVSAGIGHSCAISEAGALFCWGANAEGQLGVGDNGDRTSPVEVCLP